MTIHSPAALYKGLNKIYVSDVIGVTRHYRNVEGGALTNNNKRVYEVGPYSMTDVEPNLKFKLTDAVSLNNRNSITSNYNIFVSVSPSRKRCLRYSELFMSENARNVPSSWSNSSLCTP